MRQFFKKLAERFRRKRVEVQNKRYEAARIDFDNQYEDEYQWYLDEYHR